MTVAFTGGRVYTGRRIVEALLVDDGRVVLAGRDAEVHRASPSGTTVVALNGRALVPGLIDSHLHLLGTAIRRAGVNLSGARSLAALLERVSRWAGKHEDGPIIGSGWDQESLRERRPPNPTELDRIVPDRPVALYRVCGHVAVVNSIAWEQTLPRSKEGRSRRDTSSSPVGMLLEGELDRLRPLRRSWLEHRASSLAAVVREASSYGLTSVGAMNVSYPEFRVIERSLAALGPMMDVYCYASLDALGQFRRRVRPRGESRVRWWGIKVFLDGSLGARTAALSDVYADAPNERGRLGPTIDLIEPITEAAESKVLQLALHAIGDAAVASAVSLIRRVKPKVRPRIEHASVLSEGLIDELARVRPFLSVQPSFAVSDSWIGRRLGAGRARWAYPLRTLAERGLVLSGSSDSPVESMDPWSGMWAATTRRRAAGLDAGERLSPSAAFQLYTTGSILGDPSMGTLEPGAPADFVRLAVPSVETAVRRGSARVLETWKRGELVFRRPAGRDRPRGPRSQR